MIMPTAVIYGYIMNMNVERQPGTGHCSGGKYSFLHGYDKTAINKDWG